MRGIILAAGKGSRFGDQSGDKPKSFLEINGKKIIQHQVDALRTLGVSEIFIVVGYKSWLFEEEFKDQSDVTLLKNPFFVACNVLGSLWFASDYMTTDFYFMHADTIYDPEILPLLENAKGEIRFAVEFKSTVEEEMKVLVKDGIVTQVNKTMSCEDAHGEFTGVARISATAAPKVKKWVKQIIEKDQELNTFFEYALQKMINSREVQVTAIDIGKCRSIEIDFAEDYARALKVFEVKE